MVHYKGYAVEDSVESIALPRNYYPDLTQLSFFKFGSGLRNVRSKYYKQKSCCY